MQYSLILQAVRLKKQIASLDNEVKNLEVLLAQADPDGYYKEGTRAARLAKERGIQLFKQDRDLKSALEKRKRQEAVSLSYTTLRMHSCLFLLTLLAISSLLLHCLFCPPHVMWKRKQLCRRSASLIDPCLSSYTS